MLVKKALTLVNNVTLVICDAACTVVVPKRNPLLTGTEHLCRNLARSSAHVSVHMWDEITSGFRKPPHFRRRSPFLARYQSITRPMRERYRAIRRNRRQP